MMTNALKYLLGFCLLGQPAASEYGVDCSFPIHNKDLTCGSYLGDRASIYEEFMLGCREKYGAICQSNDYRRIVTALRQPEMVANLTSDGFLVSGVPRLVQEELTNFWAKNNQKIKEERWPRGSTEMNHWLSPSYVVKIDDASLRGRPGRSMKEAIEESMKEEVEDWVGAEMETIGMYGIRVHTEGALEPPHVSRHPLSISAIINVAQDVEESWVHEIYKRDGSAFNITLEPGQMLLIESTSMIHGHPFALNGRYVASMFFHFQPIESQGGND